MAEFNNALDYHIACHQTLMDTDPNLLNDDWHRACCALKGIDERSGGDCYLGKTWFIEWSSGGHGFPGHAECATKYDSVPPMGGYKTLIEIQGNNPL